MVERKLTKKEIRATELPTDEKVGSYFPKEEDDSNLELLTSGCTLFDLMLGGGFPLGRIVSIYGDFSTGKTQLAIEACANFSRQFPNGKIWYIDAEAAFDQSYGEALGLPVEKVKFIENVFTIEDFHDQVTNKIEELNENEEGIFILDSLDALSDKAELDREIGDSSYGASKARKLSEIFRRITQPLSSKRVLLFIISQVRENIGGYGSKTSVSGGKALGLYTSQRIQLTKTGTLKKQKNGVEKAYGVKIKAVCTKNKVGSPHEECEYEIIFNYGIDSEKASLDWLKKYKFLSEEEVKVYLKKLTNASDMGFPEIVNEINTLLKEKWDEVKNSFAPKRKKYG